MHISEKLSELEFTVIAAKKSSYIMLTRVEIGRSKELSLSAASAHMQVYTVCTVRPASVSLKHTERGGRDGALTHAAGPRDRKAAAAVTGKTKGERGRCGGPSEERLTVLDGSHDSVPSQEDWIAATSLPPPQPLQALRGAPPAHSSGCRVRWQGGHLWQRPRPLRNRMHGLMTWPYLIRYGRAAAFTATGHGGSDVLNRRSVRRPDRGTRGMAACFPYVHTPAAAVAAAALVQRARPPPQAMPPRPS